MEILKVNGLTKVYASFKGAKEVSALNGLNFTINSGEFVGIMGPSGSGKSTLLNILSGVDKGTSGSVIINNNDISEMKKDKLALFRRKNIGYIFQEFNLLDSLTVEENISLPLILDKKDQSEIENSLNDLMKYFNILDF